MFLAVLLGLFSFAAFFYLIDYASRLLRPISILAHVGDDGIAVVESVYPDASSGPVKDNATFGLDAPDRVIKHRGTSGATGPVALALLQ